MDGANDSGAGACGDSRSRSPVGGNYIVTSGATADCFTTTTTTATSCATSGSSAAVVGGCGSDCGGKSDEISGGDGARSEATRVVVPDEREEEDAGEVEYEDDEENENDEEEGGVIGGLRGMCDPQQVAMKLLQQVDEDMKKQSLRKEKPRGSTATTSTREPPNKRSRMQKPPPVSSSSDSNSCSSTVSVFGGASRDDESERDMLIRTGKLTPFDNLRGMERPTVAHSTAENVPSPSMEPVEQPPAPSVHKPHTTRRKYNTRSCAIEQDSPSDSDNKPEPDLGDLMGQLMSIDDGRESMFKKRQALCKEAGLLLPNKRTDKGSSNDEDEDQSSKLDNDTEPDATEGDIEFSGGLTVPGSVYKQLFDYQQVAVKWLWELYCMNVGGIIGDEMGLGKTIDIISFVAGLHYSGKLTAPVLVACPATIMTQWVEEFHTWYPALRIVVLHESGTVPTSTGVALAVKQATPSAKRKGAAKREMSVFITTYEFVRTNVDILAGLGWGLFVLDEGHKIRNPDAAVTLACKRFKTPHRVVMTGTPIQNNLTELWSLFDFIFPGKLGTLPVFETNFIDPINIGGYVNASQVHVQTAYKCAVALRDIISPYLLRRVKDDVLKTLPSKTEQILMCKLTQEQIGLYTTFLESPEMESVRNGKRNLLFAVDILRKICNHPDLILHPQKSLQGLDWVPRDTGKKEIKKEITGGKRNRAELWQTARSGKLHVVEQLLKLWHSQKHKVLIFCQTRQMLNLLEQHIKTIGYKYVRLDGVTPIHARSNLITSFNNDKSLFLFILTTKVGGIGVNLTGADRVILFDPDWNPSTDIQARDRVLRIGQKRAVTIYRLICAGTIEEKIYHRQVFKEFLSNKILKDPSQKRFFKARFLKDLFTFSADTLADTITETFSIFGPDCSATASSAPRSSTPLLNNLPPSDDARSTESEIVVQTVSSPGSPTAPNVSNTTTTSQQSVEAEAHREENDTILKTLLETAGIKTALSHDSIVGNSETESRIMTEIQLEATRIAHQAIESLKQSRAIRSTVPYCVPTWTGKSGHTSGSRIQLTPPTAHSSQSASSTLGKQVQATPKCLEQLLDDTPPNVHAQRLAPKTPQIQVPQQSQPPLNSTHNALPRPTSPPPTMTHTTCTTSSTFSAQPLPSAQGPKRFGRVHVGGGVMSSASLLSQINTDKRRESHMANSVTAATAATLNNVAICSDPKACNVTTVNVNSELSKKITEQLHYHLLCSPNNTCTTQQILAKFAAQTKGQSSSELFRAILQQLATFDPATKTWTLKKSLM
ncbi:DNA repair protein rhp26 [Pelomyxa schiedti]|nr:DNA repair protein rhp26 [Pelomyxa schiedti]